jgi:transposase
MREDAARRKHDLREVFNAMRRVVRNGFPWRYLPKRPAALRGDLPF